MVGWRGNSSLKLSRMTRNSDAGTLELAICKQDWMNAGRDGVVISRTKVGSPRVKTKMRVKVMMQSFFEDGGSGFVKIPKSPRTHDNDFCSVSHPPISMVALMSTVAAHLPWIARSCSSVESRVRYLWSATEASEDDLEAEAWGDERSVLQLARDAAIAGTCWGSCEVAVDEMRKVRARRVASSDAAGAISTSIMRNASRLGRRVDREMVDKKVRHRDLGRAAYALTRSRGPLASSVPGGVLEAVTVVRVRPWQAVSHSVSFPGYAFPRPTTSHSATELVFIPWLYVRSPVLFLAFPGPASNVMARIGSLQRRRPPLRATRPSATCSN